MSSRREWSFPAESQPKPQDMPFDLNQALASVLAVRARIPSDAFTASVLGTEREGNGVVIGEDGLAVTIGYLITEAESIWLTTSDGVAVPAHAVAYDQATGFGLVQALGRLPAPPITLGSAARTVPGETVIFAGHGGRRHALVAQITAKREFAGYWEYVLDEALFTTPAHPHWGGGAVLDREGRLIGVGSLFLRGADFSGTEKEDKAIDGNMVVPIDLLEPILPDLLRFGRVNRPARPWLGLYVAETRPGVAVAGLAEDGPADRAGIQVGDVILEVEGKPIGGLADFFRKVWAQGVAGVEVPLTLVRDGELAEVRVNSTDRESLFKKPRLH